MRIPDLRASWFRIPLIAAVAAVAGCRSDPGVATRYDLERKIWKAQTLRAQAVSDPLNPNEEDLWAAAETYKEILANEKFTKATTYAMDSRVRSDIERGFLRCKISLAELYLNEYEQYAGVTYLKYASRTHELLLRGIPEIELKHALPVYDLSVGDSLRTRCIDMFRRVAEDEALWSGSAGPGDTLLSIPDYMVRIAAPAISDSSKKSEFQMAEEFYSQVIGTWPSGLAAQKARVYRAGLRTTQGRFGDALEDLEDALNSPHASGMRENLLAQEGEILAFGIGRESAAESVLTRLIVQRPRSRGGRSAALTLGELKIRRGDQTSGMQMLRELELQDDVPRETATAAMLLRALCLSRQGDWPEALHLFWRICRLEPFTRAAAVTPLVIVTHYKDSGDMTSLETVLKKAGDYYLGAIGDDSSYLKYPHVLKDFLIETYLVAGRPREVAELLEERSARWRPDNGNVGLLKTALIYINLLGERENGIRVLQKCLDLFPNSRYAWIVEKQLEAMSTTSARPRKG